jgi:hypothetical protein
VSHACCGEPEVSRARHAEPEVGLARRGAAASAAQALALAAAPTFALLALWTAFAGDRSDMLCMGVQDASPLGGMATMYLLMSAFHAASWLKWLARLR